MTQQPRRPVVAVFGGNEVDAAVLDAARRFGAAIVSAGAVLLTGGVGTGAAQVKDQAIVGAGSGPWIGVENSDRIAPPRRVRGGIVVSPGVGHRRNFVGAALCDAAIALPGDDGTASEIVFTLALGRPLELYDWTPSDLRRAAQRRVPYPDGTALLDRAIAAAYERPVAVPAPVAHHVPADEVVGRLLRTHADPVEAQAMPALRDRSAWDDLLTKRLRSSGLLPVRRT